MTPVVHPFDGTADEWNGLLGDVGATYCHSYGWRSVMEDVLGHQSWWTVARDSEGDVVGALPLVRVRSRILGDYLVSMPFLNYGGPVGSEAGRVALAGYAEGLARSLGVDLLELRVRGELSGTGLVRNARKLTVTKQLPSSIDELWEKGLRAKLRSQVRRPMKEGMEVRFGPEQVDPFYDVFARTMRDLGTPVLPKRFFESVRKNFGDAVLFSTVEHQGEPVAAGCGFCWGGEFEITWAGARREHARLAPNMLLYWGLMEESVRRGLTVFNFGRCSPDSGTHRFKLQWGSEDEALPWLQWSGAGQSATPNPDSPKFKVATAVWSRLPVPVANAVGPHLSRLIP